MPGVSTTWRSRERREISMGLRVVPGRDEVVRVCKGFLYFSAGRSQHSSESLLINEDFPEFVAPST